MLLEEYINVINAIRSYVNGEKMDQAFCSNLAGAYQICKKHNLTALMAEVLDRTDVDKRSPIYQRWQMEKNQAVYKNVLMDVEREEIIAFFEEKNIWYLLLKGLIIREYYPNPALREMSDNDILVDRKYMKDIYDFMVGRGYSIKGYGTSNHDEYLKKPAYNFEMHRALFDKDDYESWNSYFDNIFDKLTKKSENSLEYVFKEEDFYIYFMVHTYKHYASGGMGLRTIVDVYLYLRKNKELDFSYVEKELGKLNIADFEKQFRKLCFDVFSVNKSDAKADWYEGLPTDEKNMLDYIMGAGTYGNLDNLVANKLGDDDDVKKSKFKYVFRRVFPDYKSFKKYHPLICRYKVLVPFGYLFRIIKLPFTGWKRAMAELKAVLRK